MKWSEVQTGTIIGNDGEWWPSEKFYRVESVEPWADDSERTRNLLFITLTTPAGKERYMLMHPDQEVTHRIYEDAEYGPNLSEIFP